MSSPGLEAHTLQDLMLRLLIAAAVALAILESCAATLERPSADCVVAVLEMDAAPNLDLLEACSPPRWAWDSLDDRSDAA